MQMTIRLRQESRTSVSYDHNYSLSAAINEAMRAFHPEFSRELHRSPERAKYAVGEIYHLAHARGEASFRIASPDERLLRMLAGALVSTGKMQVGKSEYLVTGTEAHAAPETCAPAGIHTLSPILIRDPDSPQSLVMDNCSYATVLASVINHDIHKITGRKGTVSVLNQAKLEVRKRTLAGRTVMAQKGTFWLDGAAEDIAHVFEWGVGQSTALGFGLVVPEA